MFDKDDLQAPLKPLSLRKSKNEGLEHMPEGALIQMRQQIDTLLNLDLRKINMEEELSLQFRQAKALYSDIETDEGTPANQKAQVLNSLSAIISAISKTSEAVYSVERLKKLEAATLAAIRDLPDENKQKFFDLYESYLALQD